MRIFIFSLLMLVFHLPLSAQKITGRAVYTSFFQLKDKKMDLEGEEDPLKKELAEQLKKPFLDQYELQFNQDESIFKKLPKLDTPDPQKGSISVSVSFMGNDEILYKNFKENQMINETELYGKQFLIQDEIENVDWQLSKESKTIGEYICFKATYIPPRLRSDSQENDATPEKEAKEIIAWYTPQIPVKNGPLKFDGLPGLILEVQEGNLQLLCTKIVLNPEEEVQIKKPSKGKKVNQKEFKSIMDKKNEEMMESFKTPKRRN